LPSQEGLQTVGSWELVLELGDGVFLARRSGPRRFARLGALRTLGDVDPRGPIATEIARASAASHPLVCSIKDTGAADGRHYVVTDYVEGGSAGELGRSPTPMPVEVIAAIGVDALAALHAVHDTLDAKGRPLVHGAISAQAIVVGTDGRARLSDLGLWGLASQGDPLGSRRYAAPEIQAGGQPEASADVYAMGRVLYELLGGPPSAEVGAVLPLLSTCDARVPPGFAEAIARATAPDPDQRFRTADAFAAAIERGAPRATAREVGRWLEQAHAEPLAQRRAALGAWAEGRAAALGHRPPTRARILRATVARRLRRHRRVVRAALVLVLAAFGAALGLAFWQLRTAPRVEAAHLGADDDSAATSSARETRADATAAPDPEPLPGAESSAGIDIETLPTSEPAARPRRRTRQKRPDEELSNPYR
jgi:serine/threonine-protein kinase